MGWTRKVNPVNGSVREWTRGFIVAFIAGGFALWAQSGADAGAGTLDELASQMDTHIAQPKFSEATWGVKVVSVATGRTLYENHADRLMSPASNSKLYTGAIGLDHFGGDHRFATPILATAKTDAAGVLHGDLIVCGRGDWSWNTRRLGTNFWDIFEPFVAAVTNAGIRQITGDVVGDATFFRGEPTGSSWTIDDLRGGEAGEISALTLDDNVMQVNVAPGPSAGQACLITPLQPGAGLNFSNLTLTVASNAAEHIEAFRPLDGRIVYIVGRLSAGGIIRTLDVTVPEPAAWFAAGLKMALARSGITVAGQTHGLAWPQTPPWDPMTLVKLGEVLSPPLRDMVRGFMKPSQNLEADMLLADVGESARGSNAPAWMPSEDAGLAALREWLTAAGVREGDVRFDEGSGLSRNNLTTANATVALLQFMARDSEAQDFMDSLPIAGVDGTLRRRFKNDAATGNVHAKTGTLRWAFALSGYLTSAAGERLAFSIMLNRFEPAPGHSGHEEIDPLVLMLANFAGSSDESLPKNYSSFGTLILTNLGSAPFPHPARADGHRYHDQFFSAKEHYSDSTVAMFIPKDFRATAAVDFVVHFHGWNNSVAGTLERYKLIEQLSSSGKNAILIVPEGPRHAQDSFGGKLEDTNGFASFMAEVATTLRASGLLGRPNFEIGNIILSGHSGGYHVMAAILDHGGLSAKIKEAWLFDALYGGTEDFVAWHKNGNGRLLDIYTDQGGTREESEKLMASFKSSGVPIFAAEDSAATPDELRTNQLVFLHTDMAHEEVVAKRGTFGQFLKTSLLENR
jgi:serine-type D-Ala-D-Ala carboxypeptidase/endopeptidase (penicillin-binding protein 4)